MNKYKAFSLIEILVTVSLFSMIFISVVGFSVEAGNIIVNMRARNKAHEMMLSVYNSILVSKKELWSQITENADGLPKHVELIDNQYQIIDGEKSNDIGRYQFVITQAKRENGLIDDTGQTDVHTYKIELTFFWDDNREKNQSDSETFYINDWNILEWKEDSIADFQDGIFTDTLLNAESVGQIQLDTIFYPDWCKPTLALDQYDIPGSATAKTLFSSPGTTYLGTGGNTSGDALTKLNITGVENPSISVEGTFNGYITNNIFVAGDYAYLATAQDQKEVVILDISSTPYTEVGYFNTSRTEDANSIYVVGNIGYVAAGRYVFTFDLSQSTGSRSQIGIEKVSLNQNWFQTASVSQIVVRENYLYASLHNDWYELAIVNISNPANMSITSQTSVNNQQTLDVYVSEDTNRVYFGTGSSSSEREFFIIDTSSKSGSRSIISSYDTNGMSVNGIAIVEADRRAILVGTGAEEYQVVDISTENSPTRCGGMQLNAGINDIDSVTDSEANSFSYLVTNDAAHDFQILRGGPGLGGGETGYGYIPEGTYISSVFDTTNANSRYYSIAWDGVINTGTDIKIQLRSGDSSNLTSQPWIGPDGTNSTYFTSTGAAALPSILSNHRYIQYIVIFSSDGPETPIFDKLMLYYQ